MIPTIIAFTLLGGFFLLEVLFRQRGSAKSMKREPSDRGSTLAVGASYGIAAVLLVLLVVFHVGVLSAPAVGWIGVMVMLAGLALRAWAMRVLGTFYSRTLKVAGTHGVIESGPYRIIRHPGYLGSILVWIGSALAVANWIAVLAIAVLMICVYVYRIKAEEAMLVSAFGTVYSDYKSRSWRLLPFVY